MFKRFYIFSRTLIVLPMILAFNAFSQDVHFSQYYLSPLTLNPANTGNFSGDWRFSTNYRTQWRSIDVPFNTFSLGFEQNLLTGTQKIGAGLLLLHDQSGNAKISSNRAQLSLAFHPKAGASVFHFGVQGGITFKSFDISALTFPDQFDSDNGSFTNSLPNNEVNYNLKKNYFDLNFGTGWSRRIGVVYLNTGLALYHINRPNESFFNNASILPIRKVFNTSLTWEITENIEVSPRFLLMAQKAATEYLIGGNCAYLLETNKMNAESIYIGFQTRTGLNRVTDAYIATTGITFERLIVGLNYDFNVSGLSKATNMRGAMEFAVIFWSGSKELKPKTITCDRF